MTNTAAKKYDTIARDYRVACVRPATVEEADSTEAGWVMVILREGYTWEDQSQFISPSVADARAQLTTVHATKE